MSRSFFIQHRTSLIRMIISSLISMTISIVVTIITPPVTSFPIIANTCYYNRNIVLSSSSRSSLSLQNHPSNHHALQQKQQQLLLSSSALFSSSNSGIGSSMAFIEDYLMDQYPLFVQYLLLGGSSNTKGGNDDENIWKQLSKALLENGGFTLFIPSNLNILLNDKVRRQLLDDRNTETTTKIGLYHCVNEIVTMDQLSISGGIITLGGTVPIEPIRKGGFFGIIGGQQEDGLITINGATVVKSLLLGNSECMIHEVSDFISPKLLWRYMDQLRIPGTK